MKIAIDESFKRKTLLRPASTFYEALRQPDGQVCIVTDSSIVEQKKAVEVFPQAVHVIINHEFNVHSASGNAVETYWPGKCTNKR